MKTKTIFSFLLAASLCTGFTACSKADEPVTTPQDSQEPEYKIDDLSRIESSFLRDDPDSTIKTRIVVLGKAIHAETPTEYYVGVQDIDEAKKIFLEYVDDDIARMEMGNNITLNLKDGDGNPQGCIYFTEKGENEEGIIAEVTFSPEIQFPEVTKYIFIHNDKWPISGFQGTSPYRFLKAVRVTDPAHGNPTGLCIRESTKDQKGIIIVPMTSDGTFYSHVSNCKDGMLHTFAKYIKESKTDEKIDSVLEGMGLAKLDNYFWSSNVFGLWSRHTVNLKTNKEKSISAWEIALNKNTGKNFLGYMFEKQGEFK